MKKDELFTKLLSRIKVSKTELAAIELAERFVNIKANENRILEKLYHKTIEIIQSEGIDLVWYNDHKTMNIEHYGLAKLSLSTNKLAAGIYTYSVNRETKLPIINKTSHRPNISIAGSPDLFTKSIWTLLHELGHHYSIKLDHDRSEAGADKMIRKIAELCLDPFEIFIIRCKLSIYVDDERYYYEKDKEEPGKLFYDVRAEYRKTEDHKEILFNLIKKEILKRDSEKI